MYGIHRRSRIVTAQGYMDPLEGDTDENLLAASIAGTASIFHKVALGSLERSIAALEKLIANSPSTSLHTQ